MNRFLVATAAAAALALTATPAAAAPQGARGGPAGAGTDNLSAWLVLDPGSPAGIGLGARYMIPLVPEGLLRGEVRVREELALELGADFLHWSYDWTYFDPFLGTVTDSYSVNAFELVAGVMWNWWLTPRLAVYPKLDLGYRYAWVSDWPGEQYGFASPSYSEIFLNGAAGLIYKLQTVSLRVEAGSHALRIGAGIRF